jgi:hypothetical protein
MHGLSLVNVGGRLRYANGGMGGGDIDNNLIDVYVCVYVEEERPKCILVSMCVCVCVRVCVCVCVCVCV